MKNQDKEILKLVSQQTKVYLKNYATKEAPTTEFVANKLNVERSVVSKRLNELYKNRQLSKVNTRPVIYLQLKEGTQNNKTYTSVKDLKAGQQKSIWSQIIGYNGSLKEAIERLKAALMYPPNGLPVIIFGESGTGKTFIINKLFKYAKQRKLFNDDAQLIVINCAQYANNPELLSSLLFGYTKGAFTGADIDSSGALQSANNGILFLDEVHRLSAEGQEKLFTYLDTGYFSPVGNNAKKLKSKTRLFFATTEKESDFLQTFLRRIPIKITLPSLDQRGTYEKRVLTYALLIGQAKRINCNIKISKQCLSLIYHSHFHANVGELKNLLQNIVAQKYAKATQKQEIEIKIGDLPGVILEQMSKDTYPLSQGEEKCIFHATDTIQELFHYDNKGYISKIEASWQCLLSLQNDQIADRTSYYKIVEKETHEILYSTYSTDRSLITDYTNVLTNIFNVIQIDSLSLKNSSVYDFAVYIYYLMRNEFDHDYTANKDVAKIEQLFATELQLINKMAPLIEMRFEIKLRKCDYLWLAILSSNDNFTVSSKIPAIVVAHGYATASSMADTCNHFLQSAVFTAIDLKPDVSRAEMIANLKDLIKRINPQDGLVILMDMGALDSIIEPIRNDCNCTLLVINNVSMAVILEIGNKLLQQKGLHAIQHDLPRDTIKSKLCVPRVAAAATIITTCMTGVGSAQRIKTMLTQSFTNLINVQVEAFDFKELVNYRDLNLFLNKNVIAIVGIDNPDVPGVPYFGLEEIISGTKIEGLKRILEPFSTTKKIELWENRLIENFSLNRIIDTLTIISPDKVMKVISKYLTGVQKDLNMKIPNKVAISLYVHIANMVERIIRGNEIEAYEGDNKNIVKDSCFSVLKKHNSVLENEFLIKITDPETAYIRDILLLS
ncbi:sigma 54-interacting transcriptional regulator [Lactobacillus sp. ESL0677]|uniref:sigma 54-interacting transcriptional regulator n=1 Tax=Lactobacillus sp. ESL0677 TaxID=2983208 RepID=UPI0023F77329|nr:sigma 54-interacting transcriptional regulator [Lactobacillus sp. ESL0677]WEV37228.1 sigma 54-interacting transcriptional regulator [Lactobacillus sp. ESL0677]